MRGGGEGEVGGGRGEEGEVAWKLESMYFYV